MDNSTPLHIRAVVFHAAQFTVHWANLQARMQTTIEEPEMAVFHAEQLTVQWANLQAAIEDALAAGHTWQDIADALGMSEQDARQRFGPA